MTAAEREVAALSAATLSTLHRRVHPITCPCPIAGTVRRTTSPWVRNAASASLPAKEYAR